ncbi:hypothetical protein HK16_04490 [Acetobacter senegalensis]|uniref:Uncharacterized protein n=2 Tax=Acetobacter TaxID=434 RepID=A0A252EDJ2_9PROT|nr:MULTISPECIES: hypothetical protein [Acetobacter]ATJ90682.1 hypothetical protein CIW82_08275 [Acetobacter tropicalis]OUL64540.1 hypothetical protein HK16_04490 [Acetobacter senegalensis]
MSPEEAIRQALESERDAMRLFLENQGLKVVLARTVRELSRPKQQELLRWLKDAAESDGKMPGMEEALRVVADSISPDTHLH